MKEKSEYLKKKNMFFTQQEVDLLNSWPKNAVWAKEAAKEATQVFFSIKSWEKQNRNSKRRWEKNDHKNILMFSVKFAGS